MFRRTGFNSQFPYGQCVRRAGCVICTILILSAGVLTTTQSHAGEWSYVSQSRSAGIFDFGFIPLMMRCGREPGSLIISSDLGPAGAQPGSDITLDINVDDAAYRVKSEVGEVISEGKGRVVTFTIGTDDPLVAALEDGKKGHITIKDQQTELPLRNSGAAISKIRRICSSDSRN